MHSNAMQASPGAYQSPHYKSQKNQLYQWAMEEKYSVFIYNIVVQNVELSIRNDDAFANMVEEWIQYNIDYYVYDKLCKYLLPFQHERNSNNVQLRANMAHARSSSRRARRTNQVSRAMDVAVSLSEGAADLH
jgi:hypothetical protein